MKRTMGFQCAITKIAYGGGYVRRLAWKHADSILVQDGRIQEISENTYGCAEGQVNQHIMPFSPTLQDLLAKDWYIC